MTLTIFTVGVWLETDSQTDQLTFYGTCLHKARTQHKNLKSPAEVKGPLTLGLDQIKDHTVQSEFP